MSVNKNCELPAAQVLVTVGTVCGVSSVGTVNTQRALIGGDRNMIGFAAYDAGLVDIERAAPALRSGAESDPIEPLFRGRAPEVRGEPLDPEQIEERWGALLRAKMGIRTIDSATRPLPSDLGAQLPHDLEHGGMRRLTGLTSDAVRASGLREMVGLFHDDPYLGPSLQAQLFMYGGLGALAALPKSLREILPEAHRFRIAAACAFAGQEHIQYLSLPMQLGDPMPAHQKADRFAFRLATSLNTHGPALINAMLSPAFHLSKARKNPELLRALMRGDSVLRNVPQSPMVLSGACSSALLALVDIAPQLVFSGYPGSHAPKLVLWTAADAGLQPDGRILEGFGSGILMTTEKLAAMNAQRSPAEARAVSAALAPFDEDALGTVIGNAGSGLLVTTLQFAIENFLDISSLVVGWGQSGETGGKGHFAGVGFGGENSLIMALQMARAGHGYSVADFGHLVAHGTGTRVNSRTDLATTSRARLAVAQQNAEGQLPRMSVGAPKALGDGHTMGEASLRATAEAIYYVLGEQTVGIPSLRRIDRELAPLLDQFSLQAKPIPGNTDGGALAYAQGFGGYNAAVALRSAHADALRRYRYEDPRHLDAYLERREEVRRQRIENERAARRSHGSILALTESHRWHGPKG